MAKGEDPVGFTSIFAAKVGIKPKRVAEIIHQVDGAIATWQTTSNDAEVPQQFGSTVMAAIKDAQRC